MQNAILEKISQSEQRNEIPEMVSGDQVKVHVRIREGDKERIQIFEGILIARNNTGVSETITVRKISFGSIGVERIFPLHSPVVAKLEVVRSHKVRRAKLYYLRNLRGKAARLKERDRRV
jgi:large subunit ribosomal protein L19